LQKSHTPNKAPCPLCRGEVLEHQLMFPPDEVIHPKPVEEVEEIEMDDVDADKPQGSSKIDALLKFLLQSHQKDPTTKSVVFSQWAKMLDKVEPMLKYHGIEYVRFDGRMNVKKRDAAVERFRTDPECRVFISTLTSGGLGLNLVEANQSFLLDPWCWYSLSAIS